MMSSRCLALGLAGLGVLGVSAVFAQKEESGARPSPLDPDVVVVRLLLGVGDRQPQTWSGKVRLDRGDVLGVEGYRFRQGDTVTGRDSWDARSRLIRKDVPKKAAAANPPQKSSGPGTVGPTVTANGVLVRLKAAKDATLAVSTDRGTFEVPLAELADGRPRSYLEGAAQAQRVPPHAPLAEGPFQQDFPTAAADAQGNVWVAYVEHQPRGPEVLESFTTRPKSFTEFAPKGGGDRVRLVRFADGQRGEPLNVTAEGLDVWRPAIAVDNAGRVVVVWSQNVDGNWDLYRRDYDPGKNAWTDVKRLTTDPGADTDVVLANSGTRGVWMAWQGWREGQADIFLSTADDATPPQRISAPGSNEWSPALAFDRAGHAFVAYDTYESGDYNVILYRSPSVNDAQPREKARYVPIATSLKYEARPSLAVDPKGRAWVAYEERTENWGKDAENLLEGKGSTLYREAAVRVRCLDGDRLLEPADPLVDASNGLRSLNSFPRLACDQDGRIWLAFRHKQEAIWGNNAVMVAGGVWVEYVTSLPGKPWSAPQPLPSSDGLLDNRPALIARGGDRPLLIVYNTDGRLRREVEFTPELAWKYYSHSGTPPGVIENDIQVAAVAPIGSVGEIALAEVPQRKELAAPVHPNEGADVARMRGYRINAGGKTYRFLRGDFHRHTEVSQDGGADGALEDMWRYAIDAAGFDWMGNDDHDNGGGKEYTWWLVQKTTDLYHSPKLTTMFTYERSVSYPHGHRNVMFARRGVRTLPRLVADGQVVDADTFMLYNYLKEHDGLCASHTSATGMGTDWRDVDPVYEPLVEIFQGHRNSYEHFGAPRVARRPGESIGGWKPLGMVWNALAMQYRLGFQASSDHISTHISYAVAVAEDTTRTSVLDAFRKRHCYGATDNIVLDVRSGEHIMGDEFDAVGPVRLQVFVHGTRPIAKVDIIKDFVYVYSTEPRSEQVRFAWTDEEKRGPGLSWYYVRVQQDDGEIAWGSPLWVRFRRGAAGE
ncbi:MAG: hypothetical protein P4L84_24635 [Isosphaeraceae bacterium]|nr:hypothetical protein [Isosphaeraceae bacterium]